MYSLPASHAVLVKTFLILLFPMPAKSLNKPEYQDPEKHEITSREGGRFGLE